MRPSFRVTITQNGQVKPNPGEGKDRVLSLKTVWWRKGSWVEGRGAKDTQVRT